MRNLQGDHGGKRDQRAGEELCRLVHVVRVEEEDAARAYVPVVQLVRQGAHDGEMGKEFNLAYLKHKKNVKVRK